MHQAKTIIVSFLGAVPPRTAQQLECLKKAGLNPYVITNVNPQTGSHQPNPQVILIRTLAFNLLSNAKHLRSVRAPILQLEYIVLTALKLKLLIGRNDIVQLNHPLLLYLFPLLRRKGCKVFYDAFEFYGLVYRDFGIPGRVFAALCDFAENRYLPHLNGIFCVLSKKHWLKKKLARLNPNIVEFANYPSLEMHNAETTKPEPSITPNGKKLIVYAGGLKPKKGIEIFSRVVQQVTEIDPDCHFLIIGNVVCNTSAQQWLAEQKIHEKCSFIPWLSMPELLACLQICHTGLILMAPKKAYLALGSGGGRKLFTYMAAGLPVVAPEFGSAWDLVTEKKIGLQVDTTNVQAVSTALVSLLKDQERHAQMSANAKSLFLTDFNWEKCERRYLSFLTKA